MTNDQGGVINNKISVKITSERMLSQSSRIIFINQGGR